MALGAAGGVANRADAPPEWLRPSAKQIQAMRSFGIVGGDRMTRVEAGVAIAHGMRRWKRGLAHYSLVQALVDKGILPLEAALECSDSAGEVSARAALVAEGPGQFQQVAITEITEMSDRERISAAGPQQSTSSATAPAPTLKGGQRSPDPRPRAARCEPRRETGLGGFRRSFTDSKNSILVQHQETTTPRRSTSRPASRTGCKGPSGDLTRPLPGGMY